MQNRLLLPMCIFDIFQSLAMGSSTLPIPRDSPCTYGAIGNATTCTIQGFFFTTGLVVPSYNAMLCIYYLSVIRWEMSDEEIGKYETYMHIGAILPSITVAIVAASFSLFNNYSTMCAIVPSDNYLPSSAEHNSSDLTVFYVLYMIMFTIFIFVIITISFSMISLYLAVRERERKMKSYSFNPRCGVSPRTKRKRSTLRDLTNDTRKQAFLYVGGLLITAMFPIIALIMDKIFILHLPFALRVLQQIFLPSQGIWNFIAFIRPRFNIVCKDHPEKGFFQRLKITILKKPTMIRRPRTRLRSTPRPVSKIKRGVRNATLAHIPETPSNVKKESITPKAGDELDKDGEGNFSKSNDDSGRQITLQESRKWPIIPPSNNLNMVEERAISIDSDGDAIQESLTCSENNSHVVDSLSSLVGQDTFLVRPVLRNQRRQSMNSYSTQLENKSTSLTNSPSIHFGRDEDVELGNIQEDDDSEKRIDTILGCRRNMKRRYSTPSLFAVNDFDDESV